MTKEENNEKKPRPIDITKIDMERLKLGTTDIPGLIEYPTSLGGFAIVPTEQGAIKSTALQAMREQTKEQMDMILEQIQVLARQAKDIKNRVEVSERIYVAEMKFQPVINQKYFLYEREGERDILSLIGPDEWGKGGCKFTRYIARVRLLADHTWKVFEQNEI